MLHLCFEESWPWQPSMLNGLSHLLCYILRRHEIGRKIWKKGTRGKSEGLGGYNTNTWCLKLPKNKEKKFNILSNFPMEERRDTFTKSNNNKLKERNMCQGFQYAAPRYI